MQLLACTLSCMTRSVAGTKLVMRQQDAFRWYSSPSVEPEHNEVMRLVQETAPLISFAMVSGVCMFLWQYGPHVFPVPRWSQHCRAAVVFLHGVIVRKDELR